MNKSANDLLVELNDTFRQYVTILTTEQTEIKQKIFNLNERLSINETLLKQMRQEINTLNKFLLNEENDQAENESSNTVKANEDQSSQENKSINEVSRDDIELDANTFEPIVKEKTKVINEDLIKDNRYVKDDEFVDLVNKGKREKTF